MASSRPRIPLRYDTVTAHHPEEDMKTILIVALLAVSPSSCASPLEPSESGDDSVRIVALTPAAGPVGTRVTVRGSSFSATGNSISFAAVTVDGELPNEPSVIPQLPSADGTAIVFEVPAVWRPACSYVAQGPCPFARIPTAPGTYRVMVTSAAGVSNDVIFTVTR
jgi:hypothetical protein